MLSKNESLETIFQEIHLTYSNNKKYFSHIQEFSKELSNYKSLLSEQENISNKESLAKEMQILIEAYINVTKRLEEKGTLNSETLDDTLLDQCEKFETALRNFETTLNRQPIGKTKLPTKILAGFSALLFAFALVIIITPGLGIPFLAATLVGIAAVILSLGLTATSVASYNNQKENTQKAYNKIKDSGLKFFKYFADAKSSQDVEVNAILQQNLDKVVTESDHKGKKELRNSELIDYHYALQSNEVDVTLDEAVYEEYSIAMNQSYQS